MHCKACDKELSEKEINWNSDLNDWELCTHCLDVAMDAAWTNGFNGEDEEEFVVLDGDFDDRYGYDSYTHAPGTYEEDYE